MTSTFPIFIRRFRRNDRVFKQSLFQYEQTRMVIHRDTLLTSLSKCKRLRQLWEPAVGRYKSSRTTACSLRELLNLLASCVLSQLCCIRKASKSARSNTIASKIFSWELNPQVLWGTCQRLNRRAIRIIIMRRIQAIGFCRKCIYWEMRIIVRIKTRQSFRSRAVLRLRRWLLIIWNLCLGPVRIYNRSRIKCSG